MNLPVLILHKDLRRYWPLAVAAAILIFTETLAPLWGFDISTGDSNFNWLLQGFGKWPVLFILVVAVVQEDRTIGDKAFWRTRPVAPGALFAGKILFFGLVLALPAVLANIWVTAALNTSGPVSLGIAVETTGVMLLAVLATTLVAAVTGNLMHAAFAALGGMAVFALIGVAQEALKPGLVIRLPWDTDIPYPGLRVAFACVLACVALLALLAHQYFTRRTGRTLALLALAVPLVLAAAATWTLDFVEPSRASAYPATPLQRTEDISISMEAPARTAGTRWNYDQATKRYQPVVDIALFADLHGVPPGRLFELLTATSTLRLGDSREMNFPTAFHLGSWRSSEAEAAICRALSLDAPSAPRTFDPHQSSIRPFALPKKELAALAGTRGRLTTTLVLGERAFREEFRLPVRTGATRHEPGQMWRIDQVGRLPKDEGLRVVLQHLRATTMLAPRGDARADLPTDPFGALFYIAVNRQRGELAYAWSNDYSRENPGIVSSKRMNLRFSNPRRGGSEVSDSRIDHAWLANSELVFFRTIPLGKTEKVAVLEDFEIPRLRPEGSPF